MHTLHVRMQTMDMRMPFKNAVHIHIHTIDTLPSKLQGMYLNVCVYLAMCLLSAKHIRIHTIHTYAWHIHIHTIHTYTWHIHIHIIHTYARHIYIHTIHTYTWHIHIHTIHTYTWHIHIHTIHTSTGVTLFTVRNSRCSRAPGTSIYIQYTHCQVTWLVLLWLL